MKYISRSALTSEERLVEATVSVDAHFGVLVLILTMKRKSRSWRRDCKYWIHPYFLWKSEHGSFIASQELNDHPENVQSFYRMSKDTFRMLAQLLY